MEGRYLNHPINHPQYIPQPSRILPQSHSSNLHIHHLQPLLSDYETRLRDEVLYLHSLWHRGPPPQTPLFLRPSHSTHFKRSKKTSISDKEWPVPSKPTSPKPTGSGWPEFKPVSAPSSRPATAEERERVMGVKIHLKGLELCSGVVRSGAEAGAKGEEEDEEEDDDDDEEEDEVVDDAEEYDFLMGVFEENCELKEFYVKNCEGGEFYCLICGVLVNKLTKKYKNCVALVQHCVTISKTKKKAAHRALGHVICKVLGWDVNRLPSLPSNAAGDAGGGGGSGGQPLGNSSEVQVKG